MASKNKLSVVVDLGTAKMAAVAGYKNESGKLEISAFATTPSKGIRRGVVYNIEEAAAALGGLLSNLEKQLDETVGQVDVAYAGHQIKTIDYRNNKFTADQGVVSRFDIDHLCNEAGKVDVGNGFKILQVVPTAYIIDDEPVEQSPVGITGRKIEAHYKLVVIPESYLLNLERVFEKTDAQLGEVVLATLALAEAVISEDEKEMGVILLDIGAGATNLAIYNESRLVHSAVIPFGGDVVTRDIKEGCSILLKWAEQLKIQYGQALGDFADDQEMVTIAGQNGWEPKEISFKSLAFIIQARLEEIIDSVNVQIEIPGIENELGSGIVVTGGTSKLPNFISLVKFRTGMDARKANCLVHFQQKQNEILKPENLTALGLLSLMTSKSTETVVEKPRKEKNKKKTGGGLSPWFNKVVQGVLNYVDDDNEDLALN